MVNRIISFSIWFLSHRYNMVVCVCDFLLFMSFLLSKHLCLNLLSVFEKKSILCINLDIFQYIIFRYYGWYFWLWLNEKCFTKNTGKSNFYLRKIITIWLESLLVLSLFKKKRGKLFIEYCVFKESLIFQKESVICMTRNNFNPMETSECFNGVGIPWQCTKLFIV